MRLRDAGSYRLFADCSHHGEPRTLASDLRVDGAANVRLRFKHEGRVQTAAFTQEVS